MMNVKGFGVLTVLCCLLSATTSVLAHHSFAMFDYSRTVTLDGTVREVQWTNPHIFIQVTVPENGKSVEYSIEGHSPNGLVRMGWKKNTIKAGDKLKITMAPLRDGTPGGTFLSAEFPDGRKVGQFGGGGARRAAEADAPGEDKK